MPITSKGFESRRFTEILNEISQQQKDNISQDFNTSPSSLAGIFTNIITSGLVTQEELNQAVANNFNIDKAEGVYLDDLGALVGVPRLNESSTEGLIVVKVDEPTVIPQGSQFTDGSEIYEATDAFAINSSRCTELDLNISSVSQGDVFVLNINSTRYSHTVTSGQTVSDVIESLESKITPDPLVKVETDLPSNSFKIISEQALNSVYIVKSPNLIINSISGTVRVKNNRVGDIEANPETITSTLSNLDTLVSVNNPFALNQGREVETDEEYRARILSSSRIIGTCTLPAITARLRSVQGVTGVAIVENTTMETNSQGLPPKSYECIVTGGSRSDVAQTIFETKPAGIETYGDILAIVQYDGTPYHVKFSRPVTQYAWVIVEYNIYDEEIFPTDGVAGIKQAVVDYGDNLDAGTDLIPKRFYGGIYRSVEGIEEVRVKLAVTSDLNPPNPNDYFERTIPIDLKTIADFDINRVEVRQI